MYALLVLLSLGIPCMAWASHHGLWLSDAEIVALSTSSTAWDAVRAASQQPCTPNVANQDDPCNVIMLAKALVSVRLDDLALRQEVVQALPQVISSTGGETLALGRELAAYVLAADLIHLRPADGAIYDAWRTYLAAVRTRVLSGRSLISTHEDRPNNWGTMAGASRLAASLYLGDSADVARAAMVFQGWLGDRATYAGFAYGDLSWQCDPSIPVGINPMGCMKDGHSLDGVLPDDQRRAGGFTWPPPKENYVYEALQGALVQAVLLHRAGYDVLQWSDRALLRAYRWLHEQANFPAQGDDEWQPWIVNALYGTDFPAQTPAQPGKIMGWTDWTHANALTNEPVPPTPEPQASANPPLVAFIGDSGRGSAFRSVLELIRDEGADLVVHAGDLAYDSNVSAWESVIQDVLGATFPYVAAIGNHDTGEWSQYTSVLQPHITGGLQCSGSYGRQQTCTYPGGLYIVLSGIGTEGSDSSHETSIRQRLDAASPTDVWRLCIWHKNQSAMQVGGKGNEVGWTAYETCRQHGALIMTGHEHSYSRTHLLSSTQQQTVASTVSPYVLAEERTIVAVSGLGGRGIRDQERCLPTTPPYGCKGEWARIYTSNQGATFGALFCRFGTPADARLASCYFKNVNKQVIDSYAIISAVGDGVSQPPPNEEPPPEPPAADPPPEPPIVFERPENALVLANITASSWQTDPLNPPAQAQDGNLDTRWSAQGLGQTLTLDLGAVQSIGAVLIAWYRGDTRSAHYRLEASVLGTQWIPLFEGDSAGTTRALESVDIPDTAARFIRVVGLGNTENDWNSITEIYVLPGADLPPPPDEPVPGLSPLGWLVWQAPTTYSDGTPLGDTPLVYQVYWDTVQGRRSHVYPSLIGETMIALADLTTDVDTVIYVSVQAALAAFPDVLSPESLSDEIPVWLEAVLTIPQAPGQAFVLAIEP